MAARGGKDSRSSRRRRARRLRARQRREGSAEQTAWYIDPTDERFGPAIRLEPGDWEPVGEIDLGDRTAEYVELGVEYHLRAARIDDAAVRALAEEFGIADVVRLRAVLASVVQAIAEQDPEARDVMVWRGLTLATDRTSVVEFDVVDLLSKSLHTALSHAAWPVGMNEDAARLRTALESYGRWLSQFGFLPRGTRRGHPGKGRQQALVLALAEAWPDLTGKQPAAWPAKTGQKRDSPFYRACVRVCALVGLAAPSASSVRSWLKARDG